MNIKVFFSQKQFFHLGSSVGIAKFINSNSMNNNNNNNNNNKNTSSDVKLKSGISSALHQSSSVQKLSSKQESSFVTESNSTQESSFVAESNSTQESSFVAESNSTQESSLIRESSSVQESNRIQESSSVQASSSVLKSSFIQESFKESSSVQESSTFQESTTVMKSTSVKESSSILNPNTFQKSSCILNPGTFQESSSSKNSKKSSVTKEPSYVDESSVTVNQRSNGSIFSKTSNVRSALHNSMKSFLHSQTGAGPLEPEPEPEIENPDLKSYLERSDRKSSFLSHETDEDETDLAAERLRKESFGLVLNSCLASGVESGNVSLYGERAQLNHEKSTKYAGNQEIQPNPTGENPQVFLHEKRNVVSELKEKIGKNKIEISATLKQDDTNETFESTETLVDTSKSKANVETTVQAPPKPARRESTTTVLGKSLVSSRIRLLEGNVNLSNTGSSSTMSFSELKSRGYNKYSTTSKPTENTDSQTREAQEVKGNTLPVKPSCPGLEGVLKKSGEHKSGGLPVSFLDEIKSGAKLRNGGVRFDIDDNSDNTVEMEVKKEEHIDDNVSFKIPPPPPSMPLKKMETEKQAEIKNGSGVRGSKGSINGSRNSSREVEGGRGDIVGANSSQGVLNGGGKNVVLVGDGKSASLNGALNGGVRPGALNGGGKAGISDTNPAVRKLVYSQYR